MKTVIITYMKAIRRTVGFLGIAACLFAACKNESNRTLESIDVSPASAVLAPGDTVRLKANPVPAETENVRFTWSVAHPDIAAVTDAGLVTAVNNGSTSVHVKSGNIETSVKISVTPLTLTVTPRLLNLTVGDSALLLAVSSPPNGGLAEKPFVWTTDNAGVATVVSGRVKGVSAGSAHITVSGRASAGISESVPVTVTPLTITVTPSLLNLTVGDSALLLAESSPPNGGLAEKPFVWTTDNAGVATVVNGRVKGVSAGSAHITVSGRVSPEINKSVPVTVSNTYRNPVTTQRLPDPTVIRTDDGWFYLYATEAIPHIPIMRSRNLVDWEQRGTVFTNSTRPSCASGSLWAPDINYINGQYVLYCCRNVGEGDLEWKSSILAATAPTPEGPFTDRGCVIVSDDPQIQVKHSIDPFYIEDGGKKYMTFGSFRGIYIVELADDGLSVKPDATPERIAGTAFEASYIYRRGNYYYLFCSWGSCCNNASSNYRTVVGRSTSLFGPYVAKNGNRMLDNAYVIVIQGNSAFAGPGHNAEIVADDAGNDWILYHAYDIALAPNERRLMLDKIIWTSDGWPSIKGNVPSSEAEIPVFNH
ncbi:MAG: family 43 glycosylhydrolase [Bacteroidales bacterium]|jgi:arabinan endo-1,5-alpha-L-arabinosidase|nr:family 43 glycosylhydrolase [Bacteroidales bacterium]